MTQNNNYIKKNRVLTAGLNNLKDRDCFLQCENRTYLSGSIANLSAKEKLGDHDLHF